MSSRQSFLFPNSPLSAARCNKYAAFNLIIEADVGTFQKHVLSHGKENEKKIPHSIFTLLFHLHSFDVVKLDFWQSKTAKIIQLWI